MSTTYVLEINSREIYEATSLKEAVRKARQKADELKKPVSIFETDEETGHQELILVAKPLVTEVQS